MMGKEGAAWLLGCALFVLACDSKSDTPPAQEKAFPKEDSMATEPTPAALRDSVLNGFGSFQNWPRLTPVLPAQWPDSSGEAEWLAYRAEVLPTGIVAYSLEGPVAKVTWKFPHGEIRNEKLEAITVKGRTDDALPAPNMQAAEQALISVLLGHIPADSALAALQPYRAWADATPLLGADVRLRKQAFFDWLEKGKPGATPR